MDPMIDLVRERTDDLHRVADGARRERDLRAAASNLVSRAAAVTTFRARPAPRIESVDPGECLGTPSGQAA